MLDIDPRTVRRWRLGETKMPYVALYTLVHRSVGISVTPDGWRLELQRRGILKRGE